MFERLLPFTQDGEPLLELGEGAGSQSEASGGLLIGRKAIYESFCKGLLSRSDNEIEDLINSRTHELKYTELEIIAAREELRRRKEAN